METFIYILVYVLLVGFLVMPLTITNADNVTKKQRPKVVETGYIKPQGNITLKNAFKKLTNVSTRVEDVTTAISSLKLRATVESSSISSKLGTTTQFGTANSKLGTTSSDLETTSSKLSTNSTTSDINNTTKPFSTNVPTFGGDTDADDEDDEDDDDGLLISVTENPEDDPYATEKIPFKKCCAKDESFNAGLKCVKRNKKLRGVDIAKDDLVGQKYPWFPTLIISGSKVVEQAQSSILNVSRINVNYGSMVRCHETERLILQWYKEEASFFFIFASNGTIVELNHRSMQTISMWPVDSYCMDSVPSKEYSYYVALLCPCMHKICVRKCCPRGFYYNETFNSCNEYTNLTAAFRPTFFKGRKPYEDSISEYVLRRMPVCGGYKIETLFSPDGSMFIQYDGMLLLQEENGKWHSINNSRYCVDYFIPEYGRQRLTNVLFCLHRKKLHRFGQQEISYRKPSDSDYFTVNFYLFLIAVLLILMYE